MTESLHDIRARNGVAEVGHAGRPHDERKRRFKDAGNAPARPAESIDPEELEIRIAALRFQRLLKFDMVTADKLARANYRFTKATEPLPALPGPRVIEHPAGTGGDRHATLRRFLALARMQVDTVQRSWRWARCRQRPQMI